MEKIRIGIVGYGNVGRGVELALRQNEDMKLVAVFTRRNPFNVKILTDNVPVCNMDDLDTFIDKIDVMILCGGSSNDLPSQGPMVATMFNTVDSFDTHAKIEEYFDFMDEAAKSDNNVSIISAGWDPGMFSLNRMYDNVILKEGHNYTFWGTGVSQGHSEAIRRIPGVIDAIQYTVPIKESIDKVRNGENPELVPRQMHRRVCYLVVSSDADKAQIEEEIKIMPNYFLEYDTEVNFVDKETFKKEHSKMPHGGFVLRSGTTGEDNENKQLIEYSLKLDSNPEFTGAILVAYARAAYKLSNEGVVGAKTVLDIPPIYLSEKTSRELMRELI